MSSQKNSPFYFPFNGLIWKLMIDEVNSILVLEIRNEENRNVHFAAIDLNAKKSLWKDLKLKEQWWAGLEEAKNGYVILHGYKDIQSPEHKGVFVYEIKSGNLLWENKDITFLAIENGNLIASQPGSEEIKYLKLDLVEGKIVEKSEEKDQIFLMNKSVSGESQIINSNHYSPENKYFEKIAGFTEAFTGKKAEGALDYLEFKGKIIISFYSKEGEKLVNYLLVVDEEGKVLYLDDIGSDIKGIGLDTFFLYKDLLIFVKNKSELAIIEL